jgi:hypothetical protein
VMSFLFLQRPALAESSSAMGKTTLVIDIWGVVEQHAAGVCCNLLQLLRTTTVLFLVFWVATISSLQLQLFCNQIHYKSYIITDHQQTRLV